MVLGKLTGWRIRGIAAACLLAALSGGMLALDRLFPPDLSRLADLSVTVSDRTGRPLRVFLNKADAWRMKVDAGDVPPVYRDLLLTFEDKRFYEHAGVDPLAVFRAISQNLSRGRVVSGASTLTMQVSRLLEPRPRTLRAKAIESLRALQLERRFSKDEILGMYLTLAPFGGNLEGVRAASLAYFGKRPAQMTLPEAALLVALPRSPTRLRPDRATARAKEARDAVLDRAVGAGMLDPERAAEAKAEPMPDTRRPLPAFAPHFAERVRLASDGFEKRTTIDGDLQRALEGLARREASNLDEHGGLAILVADHRSREVLAYVGAPDPHDSRRFGPIDMAAASRSPGSALKPFIYGLGFDDGIIHPETLISDVSTRFGDYAPQNFDHDFSGDLTIREALQRSLNVPAVLVLDKVGPLRFIEALRKSGVRFELPPGATPGLPVALGGGAVSLWDMTTLYAGLGHEGRVAPLRTLLAEPPGSETRFISPESARAVLRILEGAALPPGLVRAPEVRQAAPIAMKTGTSFGFRDAWAVGVSGRFAVGVWTGRPDGTPSPDHSGRNTAAPIVYAVFDRLPADPVRSPTSFADDPPAPLQQRISAGDPRAGATPERLHLVFPVNAMVLDAPEGGDTLTFEAAGGRRPLSWLIDGRRLAVSSVHRTLDWRPEGPGTVRITVMDADGQSDSATVEVR